MKQSVARIAGMLMTLGLLAASAGAAEDAGPMLAPAADAASLPNKGKGTRFAEPALGPVTAPCGGITRQLVILNPQLVQGEPLMARLDLRSTSEPVAERRFNAQMIFSGDLRVAVQPPGRIPPYQYLGGTLGSAVPSISMDMTTVPRTRLDMVMAADRETVSGAAFDMPGIYRLRISLQCNSSREEESVAQELGLFAIKVAPAQGEDLSALKLLEGAYNAYLPLQERISRTGNGRPVATPEQLAAYEKIVQTLPKAVLRPHCMIVLADHYAYTKGLESGLALLDQIEREYPSTPLAQEAMVVRHRLLLALDKDSSGRMKANYRRLWMDPTMTTLLLPSSEIFSEFIKGYYKPVGTQWMLFQDPGGPDPTGTGTDPGLRIALSKEVQEQLGLPEFVTPEQLSNTPINLGSMVPQQPEAWSPTP
ncbi:hypothetical protein GC173_07790 [bacterium]|nr:hypothetical protein [bacterium]